VEGVPRTSHGVARRCEGRQSRDEPSAPAPAPGWRTGAQLAAPALSWPPVLSRSRSAACTAQASQSAVAPAGPGVGLIDGPAEQRQRPLGGGDLAL